LTLFQSQDQFSKNSPSVTPSNSHLKKILLQGELRMKASRAKKHVSDRLSPQTSPGVLTKSYPKAVLSFSIVLLIFFVSILPVGTARLVAAPHVEKGQETIKSDEIRLTPKDFLFGIDENHPLVQAVNDMTDDVLKGNRMTAKVPIKENGKVVEKEFTFTTPSRIKEKDSHLDYVGKSWLWDSCFHAIILSEKEPEVAKKELHAACS